ncbi:hypothetical protein EVAR_103515_1 [Eumeta japonica]|uniref:Uncharacterized protein n=1 Tax=Eumeta variegata TaxID=151549 RepID=A0A4C1YV35_EUMVA|nr:hypothetical protein EVAR_103515_1 [Eumeta japonica]
MSSISAFSPPVALGASVAVVPGLVGERCATGGLGPLCVPPEITLISHSNYGSQYFLPPRGRREMGYEYQESDLEKFISTATPVASRASTLASSADSSRSHSPIRRKKEKRSASSSSEQEATGSDSTVIYG